MENFISDSKLADKIFKDLQISTNDMIMKSIIPQMKKIEDKIISKYKINKNSRMSISNLGTAYIHDVFRQLLGQELLSVSGGLKRIGLKKMEV